MRTVVGVDVGDAFWPAVDLVRALRFRGCELDLVHSVEPLLPDGTFPELSRANALSDLLKSATELGEQTLARAAEKLRQQGIKVQTFQRFGDVARQLIEHADGVGSSLIAVRSQVKSYYGSLFFGSVAKGLVVGAHQSVLIAKKECDPSKRLTAVFATDHSDYANRCLDQLIDMAPEGIGRFVVVTANEVTPGVAALLVNDVPNLQDQAPVWIAEKLNEYNEKVGERLSKLGAETESRVIDGHPNAAIQRAMAETGADLLIMGAQGHGFFDRLRLGSKSFHQAMNEHSSILILRAKTS
jgi:nucleotide-binding universal stress UspA family protein